MPHSIFGKFQPVSHRIVSDPAHRAQRLRVDRVLFLPYAACVQSVEFDGLEAYEICRQAYRRGYGSSDEVWDVTRDSRVDPN